MARISSGSSEEGAAGADRLGAEEGGREMCVPSEGGPASVSASLARRTRREAEGVKARDEWMSPRRFLGGVTTAAGLLCNG
jgi:hypothetical protein